MKGPVLCVLILLATLLAILLAVPWLSAEYGKYNDWVYCQTHEPFVQHSWNTNWHHCPVSEYT